MQKFAHAATKDENYFKVTPYPSVASFKTKVNGAVVKTGLKIFITFGALIPGTRKEYQGSYLICTRYQQAKNS